MELEKQTYFDLPERLSNEEILEEIVRFKQNSLLNQILEGFPDLTVIINKQRQIVAFNSKALVAFKTDNYFDIVGKRIGEAINCIHQGDNISGCGTSVFCRECGAARAIKLANDKQISRDEECRISVNTDSGTNALDFRVHTQIISYEGKQYTLFTVTDISSTKRKEALERVFFHDILNTIQAIKGFAELLPEINDTQEMTETSKIILSSSLQLLHEVEAQRSLQYAEDGILEPEISLISTHKILDGINEQYGKNPLYSDKHLKIEYPNEQVYFTSDFFLVVRSLNNLVKNAFEASLPNEVIKITTQRLENEIKFSVMNNKIIPQNVQLQLFQRSFTTKKSKGHGIGLYSVKLIVEQFLKGKVEFVSDEENKTIFTIRLPLLLS